MDQHETATEVLITRVVDRTDRTADWIDLEREVATDSNLRDELWAALREDCALREAVATATNPAEGITAPTGSNRTPFPANRIGPLTGWAAALVIGLAWLALGSPRNSSSETVHADPATKAAAIRNLPDVMLRAEPSTSGSGFDVYVVRRHVERVHMPELYRLASNEYGDPVPQAMSRAELAIPTSF